MRLDALSPGGSVFAPRTDLPSMSAGSPAEIDAGCMDVPILLNSGLEPARMQSNIPAWIKTNDLGRFDQMK
jgi:hypothetical protein